VSAAVATTQTTPARPAPSSSKGLPTLVQELWDLVVAYAKQETVEPLKGLGRFVAFGVGGSLLVGIGVVLLLLGGLRALQEEATATFDGNWSWAPYLLTLVAAGIIIGLAVWAVGRGQQKRRDKR
jgi:predicted cobalt transporter CbtA